MIDGEKWFSSSFERAAFIIVMAVTDPDVSIYQGYSSGTTGRPKGVERPLSGLQIDDPAGMAMAGVLRSMLGMTEPSLYLCPAPLYHAAGLQWSSGTHELGGTVVVMEKFDAEQFLVLVERESVTHTQVVPTMLVRLMKLPADVRERYDHSSLECVVHAAAPCPVEIKHQVIEWLGPIVHEYFAATEGNGMTFISAADWLEHPRSVGRPIMGTPHICDEDGKEVPVGEPGLIYFEQEQATFEYHSDPEKTRASRHPEHDNWSALGDIGYLDQDGYIYLPARPSLSFRAGVNIYPAEIEACLIMHPQVSDVAVFGLPDPEMGEYVHAVVQPADGVEGSAELAAALLQYAREHLARYKVPRVIDFRAELPRLPTGKLYKQGLRDEYRKAIA